MSSRSMEFCDPARNCLVLPIVAAAIGAFLRSTAQMRSAKWPFVAARAREEGAKSQSDYRLPIARPERATRRWCCGNKGRMGVCASHLALFRVQQRSPAAAAAAVFLRIFLAFLLLAKCRALVGAHWHLAPRMRGVVMPCEYTVGVLEARSKYTQSRQLPHLPSPIGTQKESTKAVHPAGRSFPLFCESPASRKLCLASGGYNKLRQIQM